MQAVYGYSSARSGGNPTVQDVWHVLAFYWAVGWWFINDSRSKGIRWNDGFMDMGMFLYIAWILIIPYYLFKSRGWKAIYPLVLIPGVYFGAHIIGAMIYLISSR
jgi:hypothetical protein